jgi:hypothetical protein
MNAIAYKITRFLDRFRSKIDSESAMCFRCGTARLKKDMILDPYYGWVCDQREADLLWWDMQI